MCKCARCSGGEGPGLVFESIDSALLHAHRRGEEEDLKKLKEFLQPPIEHEQNKVKPNRTGSNLFRDRFYHDPEKRAPKHSLADLGKLPKGITAQHKPNGAEGRKPQLVSSFSLKGRRVFAHTVVDESNPAKSLELAKQKLDCFKKNPQKVFGDVVKKRKK